MTLVRSGPSHPVVALPCQRWYRTGVTQPGDTRRAGGLNLFPASSGIAALNVQTLAVGVGNEYKSYRGDHHHCGKE